MAEDKDDTTGAEDNIQEETGNKLPAKAPFKRSNPHEITKRTNTIIEALEQGTDIRKLRIKLVKEWDITNVQFTHYYQKALAILRDANKQPVEDMRARIILKLQSDIAMAYEKFKYYDGRAELQANKLAHDWFNTYITLREQFVEYFPGVKPKEEATNSTVNIKFIDHDGVREEETNE